jgi:hypothetical protein
MQLVLIIVVAVHVVPAVFWAGTTFALAKSGGVGAERIFRNQMGAAGLAIVMGAVLWALSHRYSFGHQEMVLALGGACALAAVIVQARLAGPAIRQLGANAAAEAEARPKISRAYRISAPLLVIALVCMVIARYVS